MKKQATLSKQSVSEAAQSKKNAVATKVFATKGVNSGLAKKQTKLTDVPTVAAVPVAKETGDCDAESKVSVPASEEFPKRVFLFSTFPTTNLLLTLFFFLKFLVLFISLRFVNNNHNLKFCLSLVMKFNTKPKNCLQQLRRKPLMIGIFVLF